LLETNQDIPDFLQAYVPENWSNGHKVKFETESDFDPADVAGAGDTGPETGGWEADDNGQGDSGGGWGGSGGHDGAADGGAANSGDAWNQGASEANPSGDSWGRSTCYWLCVVNAYLARSLPVCYGSLFFLNNLMVITRTNG
jgi:ATP-dependent RNA helicase DDX3X